MGARLDEHGLTPKKKMFVDDYIKTGNLYKSYCATHVVNEMTKKNTVEKRASEMIREQEVAAYLKARKAEQDSMRYWLWSSKTPGKHVRLELLNYLGKCRVTSGKSPQRS